MLLLPNALIIQTETEPEPELIEPRIIPPEARRPPFMSHRDDAAFYLHRHAGKQAVMDFIREDYLSSHPGARAATFKDGQYKITQAGGLLTKDADGIYRPSGDPS